MSAPVVRPITIMIGGGVATIILLVISHAGEPGAELATGLAVVTMVSSVLVFGKPVWDLIGSLTSGGTTPTASTTASTPTKGTT
jgi:hypothetical protein